VPSWDRYLVPSPFAKSVIVFGEPFRLAETADEAERAAQRAMLQSRIEECELQAMSLAGYSPKLGGKSAEKPIAPAPTDG
jgi:hypothetical protein